MKFHLVVIFTVQIFGVHSLIVPDELPTILSVIYSNIPVIKKGTDSRLGWGFRLGNRADFQVLVELGPQTYTQPLANQPDKTPNNKRNTVDSLSNTLYAQRQKDKQQKKKENQIPDTESGSWLETWSKSIKQRKPVKQELPPGAKPGLAIGEIDAKSVIPDDDALKLVAMYVQKQKEIKEKSETLTFMKETRGGEIDDEDVENSDNFGKLTELYKTVEKTMSKEGESETESSTQKLE